MKIDAISNDTVAITIETIIPTCDVAGKRARVMHAAAPSMELKTTAFWWLLRWSTHADKNGEMTADESIVAAKVHAHRTPPGTPQPPVAKTILLK